MKWSNDAGRFNESIVVHKRVTGVDVLNQPLDDYEVVCACKANVRAMSGTGVVTAGVQTGTAIYSFRVRKKRTVEFLEGMRIIHRGKVYSITHVSHDMEWHQWTDLVAQSNG